MSFELAALLVTWVAVVLLALVVAGLVRQVHSLTSTRPRRVAPGLPPGETAPSFKEIAPGGRPALLLFLEKSCHTCAEVLDETTAFLSSSREAPTLSVRAIYRDDAPARHGEVTALTGRADLFDLYRVPVAPFVVVTDESGRIQVSEPVGSAAALRPHLERFSNKSELSVTH